MARHIVPVSAFWGVGAVLHSDRLAECPPTKLDNQDVRIKPFMRAGWQSTQQSLNFRDCISTDGLIWSMMNKENFGNNAADS